LDTDIGENEKVLLPTRMKKPVRVVASDAGGHEKSPLDAPPLAVGRKAASGVAGSVV